MDVKNNGEKHKKNAEKILREISMPLQAAWSLAYRGIEMKMVEIDLKYAIYKHRKITAKIALLERNIRQFCHSVNVFITTTW